MTDEGHGLAATGDRGWTSGRPPAGALPHLCRVILTAGNDPATVGGEGHAGDPARMPVEGKKLVAGFGVPDLGGLVTTPSHDLPTVGGEGHYSRPVGGLALLPHNVEPGGASRVQGNQAGQDPAEQNSKRSGAGPVFPAWSPKGARNESLLSTVTDPSPWPPAIHPRGRVATFAVAPTG